MKFAYADPPYFGCGASHYGHPEWDDLATHRALFVRLRDEYPEGWALSCNADNLWDFAPVIAEVLPKRPRIAPWVKPFASFKPNVNPAYAFEVVLFTGGRKRGREEPTVRDWHSDNITMRRGLKGAKPHGFCRWIAHLLGATDHDVIDDLFPGTHAFGDARAQLTAIP